MNYKKLIKPVILIASLILLCGVLSRVLYGSETLAEYARKNPGSTQDNAAASGTSGEEPVSREGGRGSYPEDNPAQNSSDGQPSANKIDTAEATGGITGNRSADADNVNEDREADEMAASSDRTEYKQGFYYEPLSEDILKRITGISYPVTESLKEQTDVEAVNIVSSEEQIKVGSSELRYVSVLYYNFKGIERTGELICNEAIAQDLVEIFYELYRSQYQIEQIHLIDEYGGDDILSMQDNNTSCFNYRVVDGTDSLSKHALGLAVDINPFFNPYVVYKKDGTTYISPKGSETYADRSKEFAYKIDENDLCYKLFKEHGFTWGGDWNSCKDYQHFQKVPE